MPAKRKNFQNAENSKLKKTRTVVQQDDSEDSEPETGSDKEILAVNKLQHESSVQHVAALAGISEIIEANASNAQTEEDLQEEILSLESVINNISFVKMISSLHAACRTGTSTERT